MRVKALGQKLVLWRDAGRQARLPGGLLPASRRAAVARRGPRGPTSPAAITASSIDRGGTIVRVPAMPDCPLEGRKAVASYRGDRGRRRDLRLLPERRDAGRRRRSICRPSCTDPAWTGFLCASPWECNYRYALDNLADPMHGCYLHAQSFTLAYGSKQDIMKLDKTEHGFIVRRVQQAGENFDWTEMVFGASTLLPARPALSEGRRARRHLPHHRLLHAGRRARTARSSSGACARSPGSSASPGASCTAPLLEPRHWNVLEQDREMLSAMPDDARMREMLYQHDVGVGALRQIDDADGARPSSKRRTRRRARSTG